MKNQTSTFIVLGLIILASIGLISNPSRSLQTILIFVIVGVFIYFLVKYFQKGDPKKKENNAFRKAAKQSKKKYQQDTPRVKASPRMKKSESKRTVSKPKKRIRSSSSAHLKVIEGKKGKKKNRASF